MIQRGSAWTVAALLACIAWLSPSVCAQDASALLQEARDFYSRGRDGEALAKLNEVLAANPGSEEAWELRSSLEFSEWAKIMAKGGQHAALASRLLELSIPAQRAKANDPDAIAELVGQLDSSDFAEKQRAMFTLLTVHGEYAAPYFIADLGSDDSMTRAAAMYRLGRLGREAVLPVIESMDGASPIAKGSAVTVLAQIGDPRGLPYVSLVAATDDGPAGALAREVAAANGIALGDPVEMHLDLARHYYLRDNKVVDPFRSTFVAWANVDGNLVAREVPKDVWHLKLAEEVLYDLLSVDPGNERGHVMLASVLLAQSVAGGVLEDDASASLNKAEEMAAALGIDVLNAALALGVADGQVDVAAGAAHLLGKLLDPSEVSRAPALTTALSNGQKTVRYHAALAIAGLGLEGSGAVAPTLVGVLAEALGEDAVRTAVVIDDNDDSRNAVVAGFNARGWFSYGSNNGAAGVAAVRSYPIEDLVVVRYDLKSGTADAVIRQLKRDARTENTAIAMICTEADLAAAQEQYGEQVTAFMTTAAEIPAAEPGLRSAIEITDEQRMAGVRIAAHAAQALAAMPASLSAPATSALIATLQGADEVRIPAAQALGRIGSADALASLVALMGDGSAADAVRGAAAIAAGKICAKNGAVDGSFDQAIQGIVAAGDGSDDLWRMIGTAVGAAPYTAAQRAAVLGVLRPRITFDGDEG